MPTLGKPQRPSTVGITAYPRLDANGDHAGHAQQLKPTLARVERGGKTVLGWPSDPEVRPTEDDRLRMATEALGAAARAGSLGTVTVERVNGTPALSSPFGVLLEGAGFIATPRGLRLRA